MREEREARVREGSERVGCERVVRGRGDWGEGG